MAMIVSMLVAGVGGFFGTIGRYLTGVAAKKIFGPAYPFGTFFANVIGCFLIGLFFGFWDRHMMDPMMNALLITRFCGGYTTFSSFSHDQYSLLVEKKRWGQWLTYLISSVCLGIFMVWLGMKCVG